jgi:hypothetical protein
MTDPWTLHSELSCPSCHVKGKVVTNEADEDNDYYQGHEAPYVCVDCGASWLDHGTMADVKDYRVHWARLVEGRPYEPPKPVEPVLVASPGSTSAEFAKTYEAALREHYKADAAMWRTVSKDWAQWMDGLIEKVNVHSHSVVGIPLRLMPDGPEKERAAKAANETERAVLFASPIALDMMLEDE